MVSGGNSSAAALALQMALQAAGEIFEIVQPFAQERIADAGDAQAQFILHALDRGFGGKPRMHRIAQPLLPALILREEADTPRSPRGFRR